jgi:hypothetical protein
MSGLSGLVTQKPTVMARRVLIISMTLKRCQRDHQALIAVLPKDVVAVTHGGGSAGTYRGYDALGAVLRQYQRTDAVNYLVEATYFLNGSKRTETYPAVPGAGDRRTVTYANDSAGRMVSLTAPATTYAPAVSVNTMTYSAASALSSEIYGNNLIHSLSYNSRFQKEQIKLGTSGNPTSVVSIAYSFASTTNNGNIQSLTYSGGGVNYTQTCIRETLSLTNRGQLFAIIAQLRAVNAQLSLPNAFTHVAHRGFDLK